MWDLCERLADALQRESLQHSDLPSLAGVLVVLRQGLDESLGAYRVLRGPATSEGQVAATSLARLTDDLAWISHVHAGQLCVSEGEVQDRLEHAVHAGRNALALLRWAWPES